MTWCGQGGDIFAVDCGLMSFMLLKGILIELCVLWVMPSCSFLFVVILEYVLFMFCYLVPFCDFCGLTICVCVWCAVYVYEEWTMFEGFCVRLERLLGCDPWKSVFLWESDAIFMSVSIGELLSSCFVVLVTYLLYGVWGYMLCGGVREGWLLLVVIVVLY